MTESEKQELIKGFGRQLVSHAYAVMKLVEALNRIDYDGTFDLGKEESYQLKISFKKLNAQDKSRSVTLQEESKEECDHKYQEVNWGDISYNKCYSCGKIEDKHSG